MNNLCKAFIIILAICLLSSCADRRKVSATLRDFMELEIAVPDDMECVFGRRIETACIDTLHPVKFIIYYDSLSCSSCGISHLNDLVPLYRKSMETGTFSLLTIFSPRADDMEDVRVELMLDSPLFPVYIDVNGSFARQNPGIPSDSRFHYFLIDSSGHPVFVGNPLGNTELERLMDAIVK